MYLCCKRYKGDGIAGHFNIRAGEVLTVNDIGRLCYMDKAVCTDISDIAHEHFAINDDGQGKVRFELTQGIGKILNGAKTKERLRKWDKVMEDEICKKYERRIEDHFLWSDEFYKAPIEDLKYILNLVKETQDV